MEKEFDNINISTIMLRSFCGGEHRRSSLWPLLTLNEYRSGPDELLELVADRLLFLTLPPLPENAALTSELREGATLSQLSDEARERLWELEALWAAAPRNKSRNTIVQVNSRNAAWRARRRGGNAFAILTKENHRRTRMAAQLLRRIRGA